MTLSILIQSLRQSLTVSLLRQIPQSILIEWAKAELTFDAGWMLLPVPEITRVQISSRRKRTRVGGKQKRITIKEAQLWCPKRIIMHSVPWDDHVYEGDDGMMYSFHGPYSTIDLGEGEVELTVEEWLCSIDFTAPALARLLALMEREADKGNADDWIDETEESLF